MARWLLDSHRREIVARLGSGKHGQEGYWTIRCDAREDFTAIRKSNRGDNMLKMTLSFAGDWSGTRSRR